MDHNDFVTVFIRNVRAQHCFDLHPFHMGELLNLLLWVLDCTWVRIHTSVIIPGILVEYKVRNVVGEGTAHGIVKTKRGFFHHFTDAIMKYQADMLLSH